MLSKFNRLQFLPRMHANKWVLEPCATVTNWAERKLQLLCISCGQMLVWDYEMNGLRNERNCFYFDLVFSKAWAECMKTMSGCSGVNRTMVLLTNKFLPLKTRWTNHGERRLPRIWTYYICGPLQYFMWWVTLEYAAWILLIAEPSFQKKTWKFQYGV